RTFDCRRAARVAHSGHRARKRDTRLRMSGQVSILLVDDHPVVREGYRRLLEMRPQFSVCAEAEDVAQAYVAFKTYKPDVVVLDLTLQGASGLEVVRRIRDWDKDARILIFTMHAGSAF